MINNKIIEIVDDFTYFGTLFSYTGSFNQNCKLLAGKGLKALKMLSIKTCKLNFCTSLLQLFDTLFGSVLCFSGDISEFAIT